MSKTRNKTAIHDFTDPIAKSQDKISPSIATFEKVLQKETLLRGQKFLLNTSIYFKLKGRE